MDTAIVTVTVGAEAPRWPETLPAREGLACHECGRLFALPAGSRYALAADGSWADVPCTHAGCGGGAWVARPARAWRATCPVCGGETLVVRLWQHDPEDPTCLGAQVVGIACGCAPTAEQARAACEAAVAARRSAGAERAAVND
jgi:hypothetical protein